MKKANKFWSLEVVRGDGSGSGSSTTDPIAAELMLYGFIGADGGLGWLFDDVTPKAFKTELDALPKSVKDLSVMINSDGGDVFAGQAIYSMLKRWNGSVTVYIDGMAASIASLIAMAGDTIIMPANAMMMVHDPWTMAQGNSTDFRQLADTLDKIRESMLSAYMSKTKLSKQQVIDYLEAETWMTAQEAVDNGFADEIEAERQIAASIRAGQLFMNGQAHDVGKYENAPNFAELLAGFLEDENSSGSGPTKRDAEKALKNVGFSVRSAKSVLARGWSGESAKEEVLDASQHGMYTGSHIHSHSAYGSQGGDTTHNHPHTHNGDANHAHTHPDGSHPSQNSYDDDAISSRHSRHEYYDEAIPYHDYGNAPAGTGWSRLTLNDFTDKSWGDLTNDEKTHIANHFVWSDTGVPPERFSDLGGGHHKPNGTTGDVGPAVFSAVGSGRMQQASWSGDAGVKSHLESHYHDFGKKAPWESGSDEKKSEASGKDMQAFLHFQRLQVQHSALLEVEEV